MTETQITFADINVGDKIRSVSPCGTERVGVVAKWQTWRAHDSEEMALADPDWTIYRIAPAFTPLPIPEEKQWIRATLKDGRVKSGEVQEVLDHSEPRAKNNTVPCMGIVIDGREFFVLLAAPPASDTSDWFDDIVAWEPIDPPVPPPYNSRRKHDHD